MRFLVDAQLPPALARLLAAKGHEAAHVSSSAIVTKDEDFARRKVLNDSGPLVVWIRLPNTRRRDLLGWFEAVLPDILVALARGDTLVEVV